MGEEKVPSFVGAASLHDKVVDIPYSMNWHKLTFPFGNIGFRRS